MTGSSMTGFNLFVYGTLRSGAGASDMLVDCSKVADATVSGTLYDIDGRFPALLRYGSEVVTGEVWSCPADMLLALDKYEGTAEGLFRRIGVEAETDGGETMPCWAYAAGPALSQRLTPDRRLTNGDWLARHPPG